jgi:acetoin utilization deacetylase AcuC-like enzyme
MLAFIYSEEYQRHLNGRHATRPFHPETPERVATVEQRLKRDEFWSEMLHLDPVEATVEQLVAVHDPEYVAALEQVCSRGPAQLDPDTGVVPASFHVARLAAGGACLAVDTVMGGQASSAFCAVRPPGHHAERGGAQGFCLFNSVAVAAEHARRKHGLERVAILDWDVHHGNGTQHIFERDPGVFYLSLHQYPHYPGTGAASERGIGPGEGATLNAPMRAGTGDREWLAMLEGEFTRAIDEFRPELLLISAGFDAHEEDPLSETYVTEAGYTRMTEIARDWADRHAGGKVVSLLEGGYNLDALARSVEAHLKALAGSPEAGGR